MLNFVGLHFSLLIKVNKFSNLNIFSSFCFIKYKFSTIESMLQLFSTLNNIINKLISLFKSFLVFISFTNEEKNGISILSKFINNDSIFLKVSFV